MVFVLLAIASAVRRGKRVANYFIISTMKTNPLSRVNRTAQALASIDANTQLIRYSF